MSNEVYITEHHGFSIFYDKKENEFFIRCSEFISNKQYGSSLKNIRETIERIIIEKRFHRITQTLFSIIKNQIDETIMDYSKLKMYRNSRVITCIHFKLGDYRWQKIDLQKVISKFHDITNSHISLNSLTIIDKDSLYMWFKLKQSDIDYISNIENWHEGDELTFKLYGIWDSSTDDLWWNKYKEETKC